MTASIDTLDLERLDERARIDALDVERLAELARIDIQQAAGLLPGLDGVRESGLKDTVSQYVLTNFELANIALSIFDPKAERHLAEAVETISGGILVIPDDKLRALYKFLKMETHQSFRNWFFQNVPALVLAEVKRFGKEVSKLSLSENALTETGLASVTTLVACIRAIHTISKLCWAFMEMQRAKQFAVEFESRDAEFVLQLLNICRSAGGRIDLTREFPNGADGNEPPAKDRARQILNILHDSFGKEVCSAIPGSDEWIVTGL